MRARGDLGTNKCGLGGVFGLGATNADSGRQNVPSGRFRAEKDERSGRLSERKKRTRGILGVKQMRTRNVLGVKK